MTDDGARGTRAETMGELAAQVLSGAAVICFEGSPCALAVQISHTANRDISTPTAEPTVMGPQDAFIEDAQINLSLVRRRLRTPALRVEEFVLGRLSRTSVYLLHVEGVTDAALVVEARRRLGRIRTDEVIESNMIVELIRDAPRSIVPTVQRTERPDRVAAGLTQGQIAIVGDGTPWAILVPVTLSRQLMAAEDYYQNWISVSLVRCIRILALLVGVFLPGFYVAIVTFHPEFIPPPLLAVIAASRENVPLPSLVEVLTLLAVFEIIREAGARVPGGIGSALTIGGTLVVGEAAVRAGVVSAPVIIVTAAVVIAFFAVPSYDLVQTSRFMLYPFLLAGGVLGMYGILFVTLAFVLYLASLRSFGTPYLAPAAPMRPGDWKDFILRAPLWAMDRRPSEAQRQDRRRQPPGAKPHPPRPGR